MGCIFLDFLMLPDNIPKRIKNQITSSPLWCCMRSYSGLLYRCALDCTNVRGYVCSKNDSNVVVYG